MKWFSVHMFVRMFTAILMAAVGVGVGSPQIVLAQEECRPIWVDSFTLISADGRFVTFGSNATNVVSGDTNGTNDVFVHDRETGETTRVSVSSDGAEGNSRSINSSISADGRFVAFNSEASNLVANDTNGTNDVFVHDRETGETTRVSVSSDGAEGNDWSGYSSVSADGRFVAFNSEASNLVANDTNGTSDGFVHDRETGETTRVSVDSDGAERYLDSFVGSISADGRFVAFGSKAYFTPGDSNGDSDVFVHDRETGETTRVSVSSDGAEGNSRSHSPLISADGRFVAFESLASSLVPDDTNDALDVFVHDRETGETTRVSVDSDSTEANARSTGASISADGRFVTFGSKASNVVSGDTNGTNDVFVHDRETGETTRVSVSSDGAEGNSDSVVGSISADGRFVTFGSTASNLVQFETYGQLYAYIHDRETGITEAVSLPDGCGGTQPTEPTYSTGFALDKDSWSFPNGEYEITEEHFNSVYGADTSLRPKPIRALMWQSAQNMNSNPGLCAGLTFSSELLFSDSSTPAPVEDYLTTYEVPSPVIYPSATIQYRVSDVADYLARYHLYQLGSNYLCDTLVAKKRGLVATRDMIMSEIRAGRSVLLGLSGDNDFNRETEFGQSKDEAKCNNHAVLAYAYTEKDDGSIWVYVYDSNYQYQSEYTDKIVIIDPGGSNWTYDTGLEIYASEEKCAEGTTLTFGEKWKSSQLHVLSNSSWHTPPTPWWDDSSWLTCHLRTMLSNMSLVLQDAQGQQLGPVDDEFLDDIPNATSMNFASQGNGSGETLVYIISGDENLTSEVGYPKDGPASIYEAGNSVLISVTTQAVAGSTDVMVLNTSSQSAQLTAGFTAERNLSFVSEQSNLAKAIAIKGELIEGSILTTEMLGNAERLEVRASSGSVHGYELSLTTYGEQILDNVFSMPELVSGDSHIITPNWDSATVTLEIDRGSDGTVDDVVEIGQPSSETQQIFLPILMR